MKKTIKASSLTLNLALGTLLCALIAMAFPKQTPTSATTSRRDFAPADVNRVEEAIKNMDPRTYRLVLPVFANGRVVGSKTYGTLPMSQVRLVASARKVIIKEQGNAQLIMDPNEAGQASGTKKASDKPKVNYEKLSALIDNMVKNIDKDKYVFLKSGTTIGK